MNWDYFNKLDIQEQEQFIKAGNSNLSGIAKYTGLSMRKLGNVLNGEEFKVQITSGFRCQRMGILSKGSGKSQHTVSAIDFKILSSSLEHNAMLWK